MAAATCRSTSATSWCARSRTASWRCSRASRVQDRLRASPAPPAMSAARTCRGRDRHRSISSSPTGRRGAAGQEIIAEIRRAHRRPRRHPCRTAQRRSRPAPGKPIDVQFASRDPGAARAGRRSSCAAICDELPGLMGVEDTRPDSRHRMADRCRPRPGGALRHRRHRRRQHHPAGHPRPQVRRLPAGRQRRRDRHRRPLPRRLPQHRRARPPARHHAAQGRCRSATSSTAWPSRNRRTRSPASTASRALTCAGRRRRRACWPTTRSGKSAPGWRLGQLDPRITVRLQGPGRGAGEGAGLPDEGVRHRACS